MDGAGNDKDQAQSPEPDAVLYEVIETHICRITLNRPHKRNAILTPWMNDALVEAFERAQDDDAVKVVILAGKGEDFCAGEDTSRMPIETYGLKKGERLPQTYRMRGFRKTLDSVTRWLTWGDKIVICACQGAVMGQGFNFAMGADLLVLADNARLARRQSRIGFANFDTQLPMTMCRLGMNRAMEVLLTGRTVTAQEMKDWGVANSVVAPEKLEAEALRYARAVAANSTDNLMLGKRVYQQYLHGLGFGAFQNFATVAHPLFTNMVWREDEMNFLRERDRVGSKQAMKNINKQWDELGFE